MFSGFGLSGIPENITEYVRDQPEITDLKIISTEAGDDNWGLGRLYEKDKISKQWASYIGRCKVMEQAYLNGKTELELIPQGTLAEKVRCCGVGIPAFYSVTGLHTLFAEGKLPIKYNSDGSVAAYNKKRETREFGGKTYLLEEAFEMADFAWIKATKADKMGNCVFKGTSYNFNALMASRSSFVLPSAVLIISQRLQER
jgi:3-oxoacid CoA-transferase